MWATGVWIWIGRVRTIECRTSACRFVGGPWRMLSGKIPSSSCMWRVSVVVVGVASSGRGIVCVSGVYGKGSTYKRLIIRGMPVNLFD